MSMQDGFRYDQRKVEEWVERIETGKLALADFQRSFVWDKKKAKKYVKAILDGRPVGVYLILQVAADKPQFNSRSFRGDHSAPPQNDGSVDHAEELVLDGQQRLTSLFQALRGKAKDRFLVKIDGLRKAGREDLSVEEVELEPWNGEGSDEAVRHYDRDCVPLDILFESGEDDAELTRLENWCHEIAEARENVNSIKLKKKIHKFFHVNFFMRDLYYCILDSSTKTRTAADIFIDVNESSMKISRFDVAVAVARGSHDRDLRSEIRQAVGSPTHANLQHYFETDEESLIPEIGKWMLKVACLHADKAPREGNYLDGLQCLLAPSGGNGGIDLDSIFADLSWTLDRVAALGAATKSTLPSWPPVHVMAALRKTYIEIQDPVRKNAARSLFEEYYWRSLFTNRHERDANQRLYDDFRRLKAAFAGIGKGEAVSVRSQIFEDRDHPLYGWRELKRKAGWISKSRLGRAVLAIAMTSSRKPIDWVTGDQMNADHVRMLEKEMKLDRHHIFPRKVLGDAGEDKASIDSALNGVYLDGRTNGKLSRHDPRNYVRKVVEESSAAGGRQIDEEKMRDRVESHLVPYDEMMAAGEIGTRYRKFLEKRAQMVAEEVQKRTARAPK